MAMSDGASSKTPYGAEGRPCESDSSQRLKALLPLTGEVSPWHPLTDEEPPKPVDGHAYGAPIASQPVPAST